MNRYPLNIFWSTEDKGFIAEAPDLPGCSAWGETEAEAAREAQDAVAAWLQAARAAKRTIPKASVALPVSGYSGKFLVHVPRRLHARLAREAEQQVVSLNQWAASKLAQHG
jgi:predicted RNase H-like HicB family nuclease